MKKQMIVVFIFALLFCGCEFLTDEKYDITVANDLFSLSENVYKCI